MDKGADIHGFETNVSYLLIAANSLFSHSACVVYFCFVSVLLVMCALNSSQEGRTILMTAAKWGQTATVELLLRRGARVCDRDKVHIYCCWFSVVCDYSSLSDTTVPKFQSCLHIDVATGCLS
jgi:hypothetical protein